MSKYVLEIGDVIKCKRFKFGYLDDTCSDLEYLNLKNIVRVGADNIIDEEIIDEDERVRLAAKTGKIPPKVIRGSHLRNDPSRASASYVVIERTRTSVSYGQTDLIIARRLLKNGCYDPKGERIWFYDYNPPDSEVEDCRRRDSSSNENIKVIKKMSIMFE